MVQPGSNGHRDSRTLELIVDGFELCVTQHDAGDERLLVMLRSAVSATGLRTRLRVRWSASDRTEEPEAIDVGDPQPLAAAAA